MTEPMSDELARGLMDECWRGSSGAGVRLLRELGRLRTQLAAAKAVCEYDTMHKGDCAMWQPGKTRNLDECTCGLRTDYDKWQSLRGGDDDGET